MEFGARQLSKPLVSAWAEPLLEAFCAGAWFLFWTDDIIYWIAKPTLRFDRQRRLHCDDGPAVVSDVEDLYFWHGTLLPAEWICNRATLTTADVFAEPNAETRRAGCEILGWDRVFSGIAAKLIDDDGDPQIGTLYEGQIPGAKPCGFLKVLCGTGREFVIPVPAGMKSAIAAQAWIQNVKASKWIKPEARG